MSEINSHESIEGHGAHRRIDKEKMTEEMYLGLDRLDFTPTNQPVNRPISTIVIQAMMEKP